jgi:NADH-quinone oxidoreductase subunit L
METTNLLGGIILAPLAGAAILGLFGKRMGEKLVGLIACATVGVSFVLAILAFMQLLSVGPEGAEGLRRLVDPIFPWIAVGSFQAPFELALDPLSGVYILFVTGVGFLIHIFATGYMHGEGGYYRFFAYLNLFMFNMLVLVLGANLLITFIGWEGVGLCSYLLIGFYFRQQEPAYPNQSAKKAFIVNRIGDVAFALAICLAFLKYNTINYYELTEVARGLPVEPFTFGAFAMGGLTTIALLMFIGATGKSAQIPLYTWLPDAMAGPTPVSALIHAATMVTAGIYLVSRSSAIFAKAPSALLVVAIIGAATALFAATIGLAQWDIKKVLAYSTVSQLGYMFLACGVGAFSAGVFHVMTHAFFKALLFLGSGSVILGMHHEQDMRRMGGLRKYMPITHLTMVAGWLAICGIPIWAGFFSKDEILFQTFETHIFNTTVPVGQILWAVGFLTAGLTAVYMTRLMILTFWTPERYGAGHGDHDEALEAEHAATSAHASHADDHGHHGGKPHESPISMTLPLVVLAVLATVGGLIGIPNGLGEMVGLHDSNRFEHFLEPSISRFGAVSAPEGAPLAAGEHGTATPAGEAAAAGEHAEASHATELLFTGLSVLMALAGIGIAFALFKKNPLRRLPKILEEKWRVDELYDALVVWPINKISTGVLWKAIDVSTIDGFVNGLAAGVRGLGGTLRFLQGGLVRSYVAVIMLGAAIIVGYFMLQGLLR